MDDLSAPVVEEKPTSTPAPAADAGKQTTTPPPAQNTSILDDGEGDDDAAPAAAAPNAEAAPKEGDKPAAAPADWEALKGQIAGGDAKRLAELGRYPSFEAWTKSQWALRQKLSSGEYKRVLPENASEEDKAKWREEMGIPKAATGDDGYEVPQVEGYEWTPADEPLLEAFLSDMHAANAPQEQVNAALGWYGKFVAQQKQAAYEADKVDRETRGDELRTTWGNNEYRGNIKLIDRYLTDKEIVPEGFRDLLGQARAPDGRLLINKPGVAEWLAQLARDTYGSGSMMYGDARTSATNRLAEIDKILTENPSKYFAEKLDEEAINIRRQMEGKKR